MIEKTISTDSTLGIEKAVVKLTLPAIDIISYRANSGSLNSAIKSQLLDVIGEIIDKQLE
tara:strand:+ start:118 stop:297 length:180 start_codon:yes stop_codon:yes gene_type:complete